MGKSVVVAFLMMACATWVGVSASAQGSEQGRSASTDPAAAATQTFADVAPTHPYYTEIEWLYQNGYTAGCAIDPLRYCPEQTMNRAESAVFVERGIHSATYDPATPSSQVFADLTLDSWAAGWVNALWQDQYTAGCGTNPLMYCPWQGHTRAEGTVFYLRMMHGAAYVPPEPTEQRFADVPMGAWYAKWVEAAFGAGLITACQSSPEVRFCPDDPLSRGLAGYMMYHAKVPPASQEIIPADRRIDWSYAGIPGGIPERTTICRTIDASVYGNGSTDASSVIQDAINSCPDDQVVYLPAGTYIVTKPVYLYNRDILRGAGTGLTTLKHTGSDTGPIIGTMSDIWWDLIGNSPLDTRDITQAAKDAQVITLDSASGIAPGDVLLLNQLNDGLDVDAVGSNGQCPYCGLAKGTRSLGQFVEVTSVNGNQVSTNVPLHWTYNPGLTPWAYYIPGADITRWSGVEDLTLTQETNAVRDMVFLQGAQYCWVRNIEITNINADGIFTYYAVQSEFRDNYIHGAFDYGNSQAYGIALSMYSSNNRVENNILDSLTAHLATGGTSGNVFAYNYLHHLIYSPAPNWMIGNPIINHGAFPHMNLWEGNIGYMVDGDFVWGSSGYNTVFRSRSMGWMDDTRTNNNAAVRFATKNRYMNVVGNILGTPGKSEVYEVRAGQPYNGSNKYIWVLGICDTCSGGNPDPKVAETILRHGNFDYVTNSTVWDPNISNHTLPPSLYLGQKPSWWCQETPWPPIGPDVAGLVNAIPAQRRFEGLSCQPLNPP
jgi:hypothetical protein